MTTISVPLNITLLESLNSLASSAGASRAAIMRKALEYYHEKKAIDAVLLADAEPTLRGDLDDLLSKV